MRVDASSRGTLPPGDLARQGTLAGAEPATGCAPYNTKQWHQTAAAAKQRDGGHCRSCGSANALQARHVDDDPARFYDLGNLLTLCVSCHREAEWRRRRGMPALTENEPTSAHVIA